MPADGTTIRSVAPSLRQPVEAAPDLTALQRHRLALLRSMADRAVYSQDGRLLGWRDGMNGNFTYARAEDIKLLRGEVPESRSAVQAIAEDRARSVAAAEAFVPGITALVERKRREAGQ